MQISNVPLLQIVYSPARRALLAMILSAQVSAYRVYTVVRRFVCPVDIQELSMLEGSTTKSLGLIWYQSPKSFRFMFEKEPRQQACQQGNRVVGTI